MEGGPPPGGRGGRGEALRALLAQKQVHVVFVSSCECHVLSTEMHLDQSYEHLGIHMALKQGILPYFYPAWSGC